MRPLHTAAKMGNHEAALALLRHGADVHATFVPSGCRPLHFACAYMREDVADLLLRWGADETAISRLGGKAMDRLSTVEEIHDEFEEEGSVEAMLARLERMIVLLARAPNDRAWRRRGFVVLCRAAHPERLRLACGEEGSCAGGAGDGVGGGGSRGSSFSTSSNKAARRDELSGARGGEGVVVGEENCGAAVDPFDRLALWLTGLQEEGLFRNIVEYL